jgi:D-alanine-D-alanine ligase
MKKINLALIGGGPSNEREVSIKTTKQINDSLFGLNYNVTMVELTKDLEWIVGGGSSLQNKKQKTGKKVKLTTGGFLDFVKKKIDVVFIALHGAYGEDGRLQAMLDFIGTPYTGSGMLASALGMDKVKSLELAEKHGLDVAKFVVFTKLNNLKDIKATIKEVISYPCVVKPNESGSSIGVSIVNNERQLVSALKVAFKEDAQVIVQQYIRGREFTCGVMGNSNSGKIEALPPVEIISHGAKFFDYKTKYLSKTVEEVCPAQVDETLNTKIKVAAKIAHLILGCNGLTRTDFILSARNNKLYYLETNTIPGQTESSLCPKEARAIGLSFSEFIEMQIKMALKK